MAANWFRVSFLGKENVLKLFMVMAAQLCEYTGNHVQMGHRMVYEFLSMKM